MRASETSALPGDYPVADASGAERFADGTVDIVAVVFWIVVPGALNVGAGCEQNRVPVGSRLGRGSLFVGIDPWGTSVIGTRDEQTESQRNTSHVSRPPW